MMFRLKRWRVQVLLAVAWVAAPLCSLPQSFIFGLVHPFYPRGLEYVQCGTSYPSQAMVSSFQNLKSVFKVSNRKDERGVCCF